MKIVSVIGARPQFIKAAPVSRALRRARTQDGPPVEVLVHTGQHYDREMSAVFFDELQIPKPDYNLGVGSGSHGWQTGQMLIGIEEILLVEKPDWVLVYGDTNSTLAGALAAVKLHLPLAHVEAGLRSFNRLMPEEHNRVLTDHAADLLLCPTQTAVDNLAREGICERVHLVGDVMYDAVLFNTDLAEGRATAMTRLGLEAGGYILATVHRPANTDDPERLSGILAAFAQLDGPVIFPVHPRTRQRIAQLGLSPAAKGPKDAPSLTGLIDPVGYLDMLILEKNARLIVTDSGGVQKEAFFFGVPCLTLRQETEWVETVDAGWNRLVGADPATIVQAARDVQASAQSGSPPSFFGDGHAAEAIVNLLLEHSSVRQSPVSGNSCP